VAIAAVFVSLFAGCQRNANPSPPAATRPAAAQVASFHTQILTIPALLQEAPAVAGKDRNADLLTTVLYTPVSGDNMYGPAIVVVNDGPDLNPMLASQASRSLAQRLATKGYTVLGLYSRMGRMHGGGRFEDIALDVRAAVDMLEGQGHEDVILVGQGIGAAVVAQYAATDADAALDIPGGKRVKALVLLAPLTEDPVVDGNFENAAEYDAALRKAQEAVAAGRGGRRSAAGANAPLPVIISHGGYMQSPDAFLSFWGPRAKIRLSQFLPRVSVPTLLAGAANDSNRAADRLEKLKAGARVDVITYPGQTSFDAVWDKAADDVAAWLGKQGLGVRPGVNVEIVDTKMDDGSVLPALLYTPAARPSSEYSQKPVFLLQHGTGGDMPQSATGWLSWRLAQAGYAVLSPHSRMSGSRGLQVSTYAEQVSDLGRWVDFLESRGLQRVILEGHSLGGVLVSNYKAHSQDSRVIGLVYLAPTRDSPVHAREAQGEESYAAVVAAAKQAVARGEGLKQVVQYRTNPVWAKDNLTASTPRASTEAEIAAHFLDFRGPDARIHTQVVESINVPALIFAGTNDVLMTRSFIDQFTRAYKGKSEVIWIEGGAHNGRESKNRYRDAILEWTQRSFGSDAGEPVASP